MLLCRVGCGKDYYPLGEKKKTAVHVTLTLIYKYAATSRAAVHSGVGTPRGRLGRCVQYELKFITLNIQSRRNGGEKKTSGPANMNTQLHRKVDLIRRAANSWTAAQSHGLERTAEMLMGQNISRG